jgi:hypothetical protein
MQSVVHLHIGMIGSHRPFAPQGRRTRSPVASLGTMRPESSRGGAPRQGARTTEIINCPSLPSTTSPGLYVPCGAWPLKSSGATFPWWRGQAFHANSSEQRESESRERVRSSDRQTLIVLPLRDAYLPAPVVTAGEDPANDRDLAMSRSRRQPRSAEDARHLPGASPCTVILNASTSEPRPLQMPTECVEIVSFDQRPP